MLWGLLLTLVPFTLGIRVEFTPNILIGQPGHLVVSLLFKEFIINQANLETIDALLRYKEYDFGSYWYMREPKERENLLIGYLSVVKFHDTLFRLPKLLENWGLATLLLLTEQPSNSDLSTNNQTTISYHGNAVMIVKGAFVERRTFIDQSLRRGLFLYCLNQMAQIESLSWLQDFWTLAEEKEFFWSFKLILERKELTPQIMHLALQSLSGAYDNSISIESLKFFVTTTNNPSDLFFEGKGLSNEELFIRVLIVWLTFKPIKKFCTPIGDIIPNFVFQRIPQKILDMENNNIKGIIDALAVMEDLRTDRSFWATYTEAMLTFCLTNDLEPKVLAGQMATFINKAVPNYLTPLLSQVVIDTFQELRAIDNNSPFTLLDNIPIIFLPMSLRPLQSRYTAYLRNIPFFVPTMPIVVPVTGENPIEILQMTLVDKIIGNRGIPVEQQICFPTNGGSSNCSSVIDLFLEHASKALSSSNNHSQDALLYLLTWPYLLVKRRRLDFSKFFIARETWEQLERRVGGKFTPSRHNPSVFSQVLRILQFKDYFSPEELQSYVDSSYKGKEE